MSGIPEHCYIVNRVPTSEGKSLAVTFNGVKFPLTATEFEKLPSQVWMITGDGQKRIAPKSAPALCVYTVGDGEPLFPDECHTAVWTITGNEGIYSIQFVNKGLFWNIKEVKVDEPVINTQGPQAKHRYWRLIPVEPNDLAPESESV